MADIEPLLRDMDSVYLTSRGTVLLENGLLPDTSDRRHSTCLMTLQRMKQDMTTISTSRDKIARIFARQDQPTSDPGWVVLAKEDVP